jgi:ABC-type multidrug transport system ATPase subunit
MKSTKIPCQRAFFFYYQYSMAILKIENLSYKLPSGRELYRDFSLELESSNGLLIYGPNGSGKSSLVKILLGLNRHYQGTIEMMGKDLKKMSPSKITRLRCSLGFQMEEPVVFEDLNLIQNMTVYLSTCKNGRSRTEILNALYENGFSGVRNKKLGALSWGEMRMIEILRIYLKSPRLIILDQPFAALDDHIIDWVAKKLNSLIISGAAVLATFSRPEVRDHLNWPEIRLKE